jgi:hypothetical protein
MQAVTVDTTGAVQIWHPGGSITYPSGGDGTAAPINTMDENPVPASESSGVVITSDGWVYRTFTSRDRSRR